MMQMSADSSLCDESPGPRKLTVLSVCLLMSIYSSGRAPGHATPPPDTDSSQIFFGISGVFNLLTPIVLCANEPVALRGWISVLCSGNRSDVGDGPEWSSCKFSLHSYDPSTLTTVALMPCRPGTCVTYNWFIKNEQMLLVWSPASSPEYYFMSGDTPGCIPWKVHWHRTVEGDVFLIPRDQEFGLI